MKAVSIFLSSIIVEILLIKLCYSPTFAGKSVSNMNVTNWLKNAMIEKENFQKSKIKHL